MGRVQRLLINEILVSSNTRSRLVSLAIYLINCLLIGVAIIVFLLIPLAECWIG